MAVLVTGGAGYLGSHTCLELMTHGFDVVVVDNLANGKEESLRRVQQLTGRTLRFYKADLLSKETLLKILNNHHIEAVVHFAGFKAVGESTQIPLRYYSNNITTTLILCEVMQTLGVKTIVFSSSAAVYGNPSRVPITEDFPLAAANPYGRTKLMIENILRDLQQSDQNWRIAILRYFNPVGAHTSGQIGEDPIGIPQNLFPAMAQVAVGRLAVLPVYGNDYPTRDGTGVRDYVHVMDVARGHMNALAKLQDQPGLITYNLGAGRGYSVLEAIGAFARASGRKIPYQVLARRPGDIAECYTDASKANRELEWQAEKSLDDMCADAWRWQLVNPNGFEAG